MSNIILHGDCINPAIGAFCSARRPRMAGPKTERHSTMKQSKKIHLLGLLEGLAYCAMRVVDTWEEGDLAAAVREMHTQAKEA